MVLQVVSDRQVEVLLDTVTGEQIGGTNTRELEQLRRTDGTSAVFVSAIPLLPCYSRTREIDGLTKG